MSDFAASSIFRFRGILGFANVTWFDLEDAFGSVSHDLIRLCLDRMHLPANVKEYISALYRNLRGKIRTSDWISEEFKFNKGVFQGDPLSPIIFIICFNPILEELIKFKESDGYDLEGVCFITLPFADDFNLITRDVRKHRKLMKKLSDLTWSMGLKLKPRKCKSLSIMAGQSRELTFTLGNSEIGSILHEKYHKFLGGFYTFDCSTSTVTEIIRDKISDQLKNVDDILSWPEEGRRWRTVRCFFNFILYFYHPYCFFLSTRGIFSEYCSSDVSFPSVVL